MTQKDQTQSGGGGRGGGGLGRSSKIPKKIKIPKRGLGVAQLEKMRIEEQQRREAASAAASASSAISPTPPPPSLSPSKSYVPLQLPSFHHSNLPSSSPISLHPGTPIRLPMSLQNLDAARASSCTVPLENSGNFDSTWSSIQGHGHHQNVSSMYMNFTYESNHTWPTSNWTQRTHQYQQPSSSMVNVSSGNLTSPVNYCSKEPPSNQNYSSSCVPMMPEGKMSGLKRSYPFSLDVPTASSFNFKWPAFATNVKANESTSRGYGTGLNFGAASSAFRLSWFDSVGSCFVNCKFCLAHIMCFCNICREVPSCSTPISEPNSKKNENLNGDFLSLAPPISSSKSKSTSTFPAFHNQLELPHLQPPPSQGSEEYQIPHGQQQRLHSFFPAKEAEKVQTTETNKDGNCNGENGESVDLNLKL